MINKPQFKQVMNYCKEHTRYKTKGGVADPFSEASLDRAFDIEYRTRYENERQVTGKIPHRGVLHMCCEIFKMESTRVEEKKRRKEEIDKVRKEVNALK